MGRCEFSVHDSIGVLVKCPILLTVILTACVAESTSAHVEDFECLICESGSGISEKCLDPIRPHFDDYRKCSTGHCFVRHTGSARSVDRGCLDILSDDEQTHCATLESSLKNQSVLNAGVGTDECWVCGATKCNVVPLRLTVSSNDIHFSSGRSKRGPFEFVMISMDVAKDEAC
ncbi:hypothetical protein RvY_03827-2 [Ramazzottius varieornatus]|uniref:Uncharacterized protein n=1 Tax=Ramazzottius varieornatus TaxID=947166 RepID=A0A1D1UV29_RAMVA|nr:hypothetical protein RvY_03827-2 [Ramazzottius varieornatus]